VQDIQNRFLCGENDPELPQKTSLYKAFSPEEILCRALEILDFDMESAAKSRRIPAKEKHKRDLLIYLLWESGRLSNQMIGSFFGLSYSAVSRRVAEMRRRLDRERALSREFHSLKSQIKVDPGSDPGSLISIYPYPLILWNRFQTDRDALSPLAAAHPGLCRRRP